MFCSPRRQNSIKVSFFYLNFNQEVKILSPCKSNTSLYYKISICADPENFQRMGMRVGSVWISLKFTKKGVPEILDIPIHSCVCNVRDIFIWYRSLATQTVIIHVTAQNEINEHGYILRQYICDNINTKMRRKKKCNSGSFNLLQFALLRFALISSQYVVTKNVSVGVYYI